MFSQLADRWSVFGPSEVWAATSTDAELADDFDVVGTVDRIVAEGYVTGVVDFQGAWVRFYDVGLDGKPGTLQRESLVSGPAATLSQGTLDVTLSPPFAATGRHFVSVQPVISYWYWWSSHSGAPHGDAGWFRDRTTAGGWGHTDSVGQNIAADLAFTLYGTPTGPGTIDSLAPVSATRSGYLEIFGENFGSAGQVLIGGLPAFTSTWTSTRVVAYVPEATALATVAVTLENGSGQASNAAQLTVGPRTGGGRVRWRFRMDAPYSLVRPALATDGTIYAVDVYGHLYALAPDGALLWLQNGAGNKGVAVATDGQVVASSETDVRAFAADGTPQWTYVQSPRSFIDLGVAFGPDGNVYSVGTEGPGVFSLTAAGAQRWTTPETYSRAIVEYGELVFGANGAAQQVYFYANDHLRALGLDGRSVFAIPGAFGQPAVGPDGRLHGALSAYSPSGALLWSYASAYPLVSFSAPDVGTDGTHYVTQNGAQLFALDGAGGLKWHVTTARAIGGPIVDPGNGILVAAGAETLDMPGSMRGFSAVQGNELWKVILPPEDPSVFNPSTGLLGYNQGVFTRGRFAGDGATAYFMTATATGSNETSRSWLYAVETTPQPSSLFYPVAPCRLVDTRGPSGPLGGPALAAGAARVFGAAGSCGVPGTARALSLNVTVTGSSVAGELRFFPGDIDPTPVATVYFSAGQTRANNLTLKLDDSGNASFGAQAAMSGGTVQLIVDVNGYYE